MTAGLPSAGIGGLFYVIGALAMPLKELVATIRQPDEPRRWRLAGRQATIAIGILAGIWVTGLGLGYLIGLPGTSSNVFGELQRVSGSTNVLRWVVLVMSLGMLAAVLSVVQIARFVVRQRGNPIDRRGGGHAHRVASVLMSSVLFERLMFSPETLRYWG